MDIKIYNNTKLNQKCNKPENEKRLEINLNKINDSNTTKEEESIYITDENIQYCSSPKSGLVSIKRTKNNNNAIINIGSQISNITNTITFKIAMIKKEINGSDIKSDIPRSNTNKKKEKEINDKQNNDNNNENNNIENINNKSNISKDSQNYRDKKNKSKSFFKKQSKRCRNSNDQINKMPTCEINATNSMKKNSKVKKKKSKVRKSQEKNENNNYEQSKSSIYFEKEKNIKKVKKKTQKIKNKPDFQKLIDKKREKEKEKEKEKEIDEGKSPKIIILDFSHSGYSEDNDEDSEKELKINKLNEEEKNNEIHSIKNNNSLLNYSIKNEENESFNKSKKEDDDNNSLYSYNKKSYTKELLSEKKFVTPKSKNSCFLGSKSYKISPSKLECHHKNRKLSANYGTKCIIKTKLITKIEDIKKSLKKDKKRKENEDFFNICASKNFNHNEEYQKDNTLEIKENIRKINKKKTKVKIKSNNELNSRKDSNKSFHHNNTPVNKKFRHIVSHNYDKKVNEQKLNNLNTPNKATDSSTYANTPKNTLPKKAIYCSNRNLTNIKISSQAVENKDIHLEMNGKQETIINYTNQEMVDDENEYMIECFKILLKLDKSKQPRCKNKVNFNFEYSPNENKNKKIALFDLDETLVHCTKEKKGLNGDSVNIELPTNKVVNVGLNIRPHWKEALDLIKKHYHIVVYTASHQSYADAVLDYIDKDNKYFQYRLYRNHCVQCDVDGIKFYVKDLDTLSEKYNLKDVVLIDNSVLSFAYHLNNGIPIVPYIEQKEDSQLLMLAYYLLSIANFDDLTEENKKHINIEHFILEVKDLENEEEEAEENENINNDNKNADKNNNNKENNKDNNKDNDIRNETKNINNNVVNSEKVKNDDKNEIQIEKKEINDNKKKEKRYFCRKSEKALKIVNDIKQNMADVYNKKL